MRETENQREKKSVTVTEIRRCFVGFFQLSEKSVGDNVTATETVISHLKVRMKGSSTLIASIMAASTVAFTASGERNVSDSGTCSTEGSSSVRNDERSSSSKSEKEKFAPRFDGLRFIETLVTAHR